MQPNNIATYLIKLNAFGFDFRNPTLWASGTYNPPYVDNRKLQSSVEARSLLRKELSSLIKNPETVSYVYGIPKAGIAPAVLLALEIKKPLIIKHEGHYYSIDLNAIEEIFKEQSTQTIIETFKKPKLIAGTVPFGILCGIPLAEKLQKPFIFVREKAKDHGLKQQIEGVYRPGDTVGLASPSFKQSGYALEAIEAIKEAEMNISSNHAWCWPIDFLLRDLRVFENQRIIAMEDLVSTGESSLKEITDLIKRGAYVEPYSIFSYELPASVKNFAEHGLTNKSVVTFKELLREYKRAGHVTHNDEQKLWDWHANQTSWGKDNGF